MSGALSCHLIAARLVDRSLRSAVHRRRGLVWHYKMGAISRVRLRKIMGNFIAGYRFMRAAELYQHLTEPDELRCVDPTLERND